MNTQNYIDQYNALDDKEKIRRLEWIAQCYASAIEWDNWKESFILDATKHWASYEESLEEYKDTQNEN